MPSYGPWVQDPDARLGAYIRQSSLTSWQARYGEGGYIDADGGTTADLDALWADAEDPRPSSVQAQVTRDVFGVLSIGDAIAAATHAVDGVTADDAVISTPPQADWQISIDNHFDSGDGNLSIGVCNTANLMNAPGYIPGWLGTPLIDLDDLPDGVIGIEWHPEDIPAGASLDAWNEGYEVDLGDYGEVLSCWATVLWLPAGGNIVWDGTPEPPESDAFDTAGGQMSLWSYGNLDRLATDEHQLTYWATASGPGPGGTPAPHPEDTLLADPTVGQLGIDFGLPDVEGLFKTTPFPVPADRPWLIHANNTLPFLITLDVIRERRWEWAFDGTPQGRTKTFTAVSPRIIMDYLYRPPRWRYIYDRRPGFARIYPRDDRYTPSPRLYPPPRSRQTPGRLTGYQ